MGGIEIIARDKEGKIKQDYSLQKDKEGKKIQVDKLKEEDNERRGNKTDIE
jgi:hypothetical protein